MPLTSADGYRNVPPWTSGWFWGVPAASGLLMLALYLSGDNQVLFLWINGHAGAATGDVFWANVTVLGDSLVALTLLLWLVGRRGDIVWAVIVAAVVATALSQGLKHVLDVARPAAVLSPDVIHVIGTTYRRDSFPSGHTTTVFTVLGVVCLRLERRAWAGLLLPVGMFIALARVAVGAHWPMDLLGGAVCGWIAAVCGVWLASRASWGEGRWGQTVIGIFLVAAAIGLIDYDTGYHQARMLERFLAVASLIAGGINLVRLWRPNI
jgi:membrane-associated phospholipid phosphatase